MGGPKKHGIGMALGGYPFRPGLGAATIRVNPDGTAHVLVGVTDIGTGAKSTMAIIAAEALGIPLNQIQLTNGDTDVTPYSVGESGSRTTSFTGPAVIAAAEDVRRQIFALAAGQLKVKAEELDLRDGEVFVKAESGAENAAGTSRPKRRRADRPGDDQSGVQRCGRQKLLGALRRSGSRHVDRPREDHALRRGARLAARFINRLAGREPDQRRRRAGHRHGVHRRADHRQSDRRFRSIPTIATPKCRPT